MKRKTRRAALVAALTGVVLALAGLEPARLAADSRRLIPDVMLIDQDGQAVNFYDHFLYEGSDGKLHLPLTRSPEWADATDCTYDLSLIRWGCATLLDCLRVLRTDHPRAGRWREILQRLVPDYVEISVFRALLEAILELRMTPVPGT